MTHIPENQNLLLSEEEMSPEDISPQMSSRPRRPARKRPVKREEIRPALNMDYQSPLEIPASLKKDGYSYAWVRKSVRGEDDFRVEQMAARRWTPVPSSRAPGLSLDPLNRNPLSRNYICYKDLLLMERPMIYSAQEEEAFNRLNRTRIRSLTGVVDDLRDFTKALPSIGSF